ncbi:MAG: response regulator, partial [Desulfomonile tiedjei]|nr:response regulator [Desulfomonile tiedjei]
MKIFFLEDDSDLRDVIKSRLENAGHTVIEWGYMRGAVEEISNGDFDLLIVDMELPEYLETPGELLRDAGVRVLEDLARSNDIIPPTIFLTAYEYLDSENRIDALHLMNFGRDVLTYVRKDINQLRELLKTVDRVRVKVEKLKESGGVIGSVSPHFSGQVQISAEFQEQGVAITYSESRSKTAFASVSRDHLSALVRRIQEVLSEVTGLEWEKPDTGSYCSDINIPPHVSKCALAKLAEAGYLLYQAIFLANPKSEIANIGNRLRKAARRKW